MKKYNISLLRLLSTLLIFVSHLIFFSEMLTDSSLTVNHFSDTFFPLFFGVNIFLSISAILYYEKEIKKGFLKKQLKKILIPALTFLFFVLIIQFSTNTFNVEVFGNLWYIIEILLCYLILPILFQIKNGQHLVRNIIIVACIIILETILSVFTMIQVGFIGFVIAYFLTPLLKNKNYALVLFFIVCFVMSCFSYLSFDIYTLKHWLCMIMGVCFTFSFLSIIEISSQNSIKFLDISDKFSYEFYIVQQCLMVGSLSVLTITIYPILNYILVFILTLVLSVILFYLSKYIEVLIQKIVNCKK